MFIDTHAHLYVEQFATDNEEVIARAQEAGVESIILPDIDSFTRDEMFSLASRYPAYLRTMVGVHPTSINDNPAWREEVAAVVDIVRSSAAPQLCGVGEVGLDLYWSRDFLAEQSEALRIQLELSIESELPVAIHVRDAWAEITPILSDYKGELRGVVHAYSGGVQEYEAIKSVGDFKFGIGGVVTFKRASLADVVAAMSLSDIILETDAPYLTPSPHRGKRNEPSYIPLIADKIAALKGITLDEVARTTTRNAHDIFGV